MAESYQFVTSRKWVGDYRFGTPYREAIVDIVPSLADYVFKKEL